MPFKDPMERKEYDAKRKELRQARRRLKRKKPPSFTVQWRDERFQELERLIAFGKEENAKSSS